MQSMPKVGFASGNAGKHAELAPLLAQVGLTLVGQDQLGVSAAAETASTFVENALLKARHLANATGLAALADDSGLMVDALDGAPGVRSARFAGEQATDAQNNALLQERMQGISHRRACFCCVLVLLRDADDPCPLIACGNWWGEIAHTPAGDSGFGYDPLFFDPALGRTAAQLGVAWKMQVSHRSKAMDALRVLLDANAWGVQGIQSERG